MKFVFPFPLRCLTLVLLLVSCTGPAPTTAQTPGTGAQPVIPSTELLNDFKTWWTYHYEQVDLTTDFVPADENGVRIGKEQFLRQLSSGNYFTIEQTTDSAEDHYRLYPLTASAHPAMSATLKSIASLDLKRFRMEGMDFPGFSAETLSGKSLSNEHLTGKYTVFKTWFIACKPCIREIPELNELVDAYRNRDDIQFVSLAIDDAEALREFMTRARFDYEVVASQQGFIKNDLHLATYPTHLVVGPRGKVLKVVGKVGQLRRFLESL